MQNNICYIRTQKKLTLKEVSRMYEAAYAQKLDAVTLGKIEADEKTPAPEVFINLAELFDVTLDYLLDRADAPKEELRMYEKGFRQD